MVLCTWRRPDEPRARRALCLEPVRAGPAAGVEHQPRAGLQHLFHRHCRVCGLLPDCGPAAGQERAVPRFDDRGGAVRSRVYLGQPCREPDRDVPRLRRRGRNRRRVCLRYAHRGGLKVVPGPPGAGGGDQLERVRGGVGAAGTDSSRLHRGLWLAAGDVLAGMFLLCHDGGRGTVLEESSAGMEAGRMDSSHDRKAGPRRGFRAAGNARNGALLAAAGGLRARNQRRPDGHQSVDPLCADHHLRGRSCHRGNRDHHRSVWKRPGAGVFGLDVGFLRTHQDFVVDGPAVRPCPAAAGAD